MLDCVSDSGANRVGNAWYGRKVQFVIPWKRAGVLDEGRPAAIAASGT